MGGGAGGGGDARTENRKRLEELLKLPENAVCADCPERGAFVSRVGVGIGLPVDGLVWIGSSRLG